MVLGCGRTPHRRAWAQGAQVLGPGSQGHHAGLGSTTKHECGLCRLGLFLLVSVLQLQDQGRMRRSALPLPARRRRSVRPRPARMRSSGIFIFSPPQCFESVSHTGLPQSHGLTSSLLNPGKTIYSRKLKSWSTLRYSLR